MNSRMLAYQFAHHHQRRLKPIGHAVANDRPSSDANGQGDWVAFLRLAIVLALTGCAIALLHWLQ